MQVTGMLNETITLPWKAHNPAYPQGTNYTETEKEAHNYAARCHQELGVPMAVTYVGPDGE